LHPSGVAKSSTIYGWGKGGKVTAAGWHITLCDPTWRVIPRSGVVKFHELLDTVYFTILYLLINVTCQLTVKRLTVKH